MQVRVWNVITLRARFSFIRLFKYLNNLYLVYPYIIHGISYMKAVLECYHNLYNTVTQSEQMH